MAPRGWRVRGLAWRLSQPGFDPSYGKLICLATLMITDRTKQICLWMTIYIYRERERESMYVCVTLKYRNNDGYNYTCTPTIPSTNMPIHSLTDSHTHTHTHTHTYKHASLYTYIQCMCWHLCIRILLNIFWYQDSIIPTSFQCRILFWD